MEIDFEKLLSLQPIEDLQKKWEAEAKTYDDGSIKLTLMTCQSELLSALSATITNQVREMRIINQNM